MRGLGGGPGLGRLVTTPALYSPFARHVRVRTIWPLQVPRDRIESRHERLALIPNEEACLVHRRIGEAPQGIGVVSQEIGRDERLFLVENGRATEGTVCGTRPESLGLHNRKIAAKAPAT